LTGTEGRYILVKATIQDSPFLLVNLYTPTKSREQCNFFDDVKSALDELNLDPDCEIIIGGDFNTHLNPTLENLGGRIETKPSVRRIKELMMTYDLIDIWRTHHPEKKSFTWTQKKLYIKRRLDFWLISNAVQDNVSKGSGQNNYTQAGPTFGVGGEGGGFSKTPPIFEHYQQHFIGF